MARRVRVAQLGIGHMHAYKFEALRRLVDEFEVVGVCEDDPDTWERLGDHVDYRGVPRLTRSQLLSDPSVEAVLVETHETLLIEAGLDCIRAGKHIQIDKPPSEQIEPFAQLLSLAELQSRIVQVGYMYRNNPAIAMCIEMARSGVLGSLSRVEATMERFDHADSRAQYRPFDAGAGFIFMGHLIDIATTLLGAPDLIRSTLERTREDDIVDRATTALTYENGASATLRVSIIEENGFEKRHLTVTGGNGTITVAPLETTDGGDVGAVTMVLTDAVDGWASGSHDVPMPEPLPRYDRQLIEFARLVRGEIANPYPYSHELLVQRTLLAACADDSPDIDRYRHHATTSP